MTTFFIKDQNDVNWAEVEVTQAADGDLKFTVTLLDPNSSDLRALFFNVTDNSLLSGLSVDGPDVTDFATGNVTDLGDGANVNGLDGPYEVGVEFGTSGSGDDLIRTTMFTLSHDTADLFTSLVSEQDFAVRITSVGNDGEDSLKLTGEAPEIADPIPPTVGDDDQQADEGNLAAGSHPEAGGAAVQGSVSVNDPDGTVEDVYIQDKNGDFILVVDDGEVVPGVAVEGDHGTLSGFSFTQDAAGDGAAGSLNYNYTLNSELDHDPGDGENVEADADTFAVKVEDNDGLQSNIGEIAIDIKDDVPLVDASNVTLGGVTHDETAGIGDLSGVDDDGNNTASSTAASGIASAVQYGADGAGSTSLELKLSAENVDSGLDAAVGGDIKLSTDAGSGNIVGTDEDGDTVFTVSIDDNGKVKVTQHEGIDHSPSTGENEIVSTTNGLIQVEITAEDADGDKAVDTTTGDGIILSFVDDIPEVESVSPGDELGIANQDGATIMAQVNADGGADGIASYEILDFDGKGILDASIDSSTGELTFTVLEEIPPIVIKLDTDNIKAGGPDTNSIEVGTTGGDEAYIVKITGEGGNINESNANVGVDNGNLDPGEGLTFQVCDSDGEVQDLASLSIGTKVAKETNYEITLLQDGKEIASYEQSVPKGGAISAEHPDGETLFDEVRVENLDGNAVKIGLGAITIELAPDPQSFALDIQVTDNDGDKDILQTADFDNDGDLDSMIVTVDPTLNAAGA